MSQTEPIACLWIALAYYTGLPIDSDQVKKMAQVVGQLAPYLPEFILPGQQGLDLEGQDGTLRVVRVVRRHRFKGNGEQGT